MARPEVRPRAVIAWFPVRVAPSTMVVQKAPLAPDVTDELVVALSRVTLTVSPGAKPWPQNVMLDPAVGAPLLTEVVG